MQRTKFSVCLSLSMLTMHCRNYHLCIVRLSFLDALSSHCYMEIFDWAKKHQNMNSVCT